MNYSPDDIGFPEPRRKFARFERRIYRRDRYPEATIELFFDDTVDKIYKTINVRYARGLNNVLPAIAHRFDAWALERMRITLYCYTPEGGDGWYLIRRDADLSHKIFWEIMDTFSPAWWDHYRDSVDIPSVNMVIYSNNDGHALRDWRRS